MEKPVIPTVYPIQDGRFVTVHSEAWNSLCNVVNDIVNAVNAQSESIAKIVEDTNGAIEEIHNILNTHESNTAKIAEIVEEIYDTLE